MIKLYKPNETDFTHNGIGVLDPNIYEPSVEEELNGLFVFKFKYPIFAPYGTEIDGMSIIKTPTPDGEQLFRVVLAKPSMGELDVTCYHIFYDLTENLIEDIFPESVDGSGALDRIARGCQYKHPFVFLSDIPKVSSARIVRKNPVEAILDSGQENSFINRWGGELLRDNFDVKMLNNRGRDRGVEIRHKKNLLGYEGNVDWKSPITRIMPQGFDGLFLPEKYVDSPLIDKYPHPKIRIVEFKHIKAAIGENEHDEDAVPLEEAYKLLRKAAQEMFTIQKVDQPKATYKVEFQELSKTEEYKDFSVLQSVYMGDTISVIHGEDNFYVQAKVISYKYDPLKKEYTNLTIGNFKDSFTNVLGKIERMQDELSDMPISILEAAKNNATNLINSGFGGHVRTYPERILIMDTDSEKTAKKVWQWNINGLGFSSKGINGPYETAMTMDGRIVADFIATGTLDASLAKIKNLVADDIVSGILRSRNNRFRIDLDRSGLDFYSETGKLVTKIAQAKTRQADGSSAEITYFGVSEAEGVATGLAFGKRAADGSFGNSIYIESRYGDVYMRPPTLYIIPSEKMRVEARAEFHHPVRFDASPLSKIEGAMKGEEWTIVPGEGDRGGAAIRPWTSGNGSLGTATHRWQEAWIGWINGQDIGLKFKAISDADFKAGEARRVADWASGRVEEVNKIAVNAANAVSGKADASALGWQIARIDNAFARIEALERK
ncbi:phage tail spike protein [Bacillus wiedmannii]|uniref:phage tail spike protein n=1 Tax=Bacillus wiedmannii TaxID=1890302 RepID=UPI000D16533F|nr:phage tail spike protein [Bacillus wiedmannii]PTC15442.1 endopeptidase [Bacillus wiedmannii]